MMSGKVESAKKNSGDVRFLQEIEALGQAMYLNTNSSKRLVAPSDLRSKSVGKSHLPDSKGKPKAVKEESSHKEKKSSIWNWKPLKAFSHIRNRRFNCCFSLQVHSVEGLSEEFDNTSLCVLWKRRDGGLQTRPVRVLKGKVEFEETLTHNCSVYGSGNGPQHSAKYEAKYFLLYVSLLGAPDLDLGKHRIDLTRLLPLTLEELEEDKCSGKWTTSFKLSGKAKGASLNVSFGFLVIGDNPVEPLVRRASDSFTLKQSRLTTSKSGMGFYHGDWGTTQRAGNHSGIPNQRPRTASRSVDLKILHEVLPSSRSVLPANSMPSPHEKPDEGKVDSSACSKPELEAFSEPIEPLNPMSDSRVLSENIEPLKPIPMSQVLSEQIETVKPMDDSQVLSKEIEPLKPMPDSGLSSEYVEPLKPGPPLSGSGKDNLGSDCEDTDFTVIEQGIEMSTKGSMELDEETEKVVDEAVEKSTEVDEVSKCSADHVEDIKPSPQDENYVNYREKFLMEGADFKGNNIFSEETMIRELDSAFENLSIFDATAFDSPQYKDGFPMQENYSEVKSSYKASKVGKSLSLDYATESVASEFLSNLGIEHSPFGLSSDSDPESPRERLLRQFEKETLASGSCIFGFDIGNEEAEFSYNGAMGSEWGNLSEETLPIVQASEDGQLKMPSMNSKTRAKLLEDMETETLMREWGLNEKAFQNSPPSSASGFGSPIHLPPEEPLELPPLGEGLGSFIQTKDGGFLRSMNPALFKSAKNTGNLIMQVSSPVVVPAEMGSGVMDILQHLASVGIEKLSMQANRLMPLEDITGKTMHQVAWEAVPGLEAPEREFLMQHEAEVMGDALDGRRKGGSSCHKSSNLNSSSQRKETDSEYVSLEDLAPLAMDKIEALSIEGLRIQSGMSDEDAPSNISPQAFGDVSALEGKRASTSGSLGLEGAGVLQLLDMKDGGDTVDGLMGLSITLDEWMRLDAGIVDEEEDEISERTSKILAAHHATAGGGWKANKKRGKRSGRKCGMLSNNFTVALMVQLRDPLRNYEPVGTPMLSLIQVERVFVPPKPKIYRTVSERINNEEEDESEPISKDHKDEMNEEKKEEEQGIPQFRITEVHVAGLKTEPEKKKGWGWGWGTKKQEQSGSRWLVASGMGKSNKHPLMKSKAVAKSSPQVTTTVQPGETLWSISSRVHGSGEKWKDLAALNPHIRNPNVIFPNETIRLR